MRAPAVSNLEGVDLFQVPSAYRGDALRLLNESFCYCGCARTVAACLGNRSACSCVACSERMAQFIIGLYAAGGSSADVEAAVVEAFQESYNAAPHPFDLEDQPALGPSDAKHTIVEFADFRCPHCRQAFGELVEFVKGRSDVRLVYYYFPLSGFGEVSIRAARAAEAARLQGKFWEMAELLYRNQLSLEASDVAGYAKQLGLDMKKFEKDLAGDATQSSVMADKSIGTSAGVAATPAVYIDGRPLGLPHDAESLSMRLAMEDDRDACD